MKNICTRFCISTFAAMISLAAVAQVVIFPPVELDSPVVEALGREKSGRIFFATCRTDGSKLGF